MRLFDRSQRTVSLTEAGGAFLTEARRVLLDAEAARLAARNACGRAAHRLRIGYLPTSLPVSVPRALQPLAAGVTNLETSPEPGKGAELVEAVRTQRLDAAIVSLPAPTAGLHSLTLGDEHAVPALPLAHRHDVAPAIRLSDDARPLDGCCIRRVGDYGLLRRQNSPVSPRLANSPSASSGVRRSQSGAIRSAYQTRASSHC